MKGPPIEQLRVQAFKVPTDAPESDGTYEWDSTTMVLVETLAGNTWSLGYTYADEATATLIKTHLQPVVLGCDAISVNDAWSAMVRSVRNLGLPGICSMAISAVDTALWDLKARLLGLSLVRLLGQVREAIPIYGSGGFTSYSEAKLQEQLAGWVNQGISRVKMKVGRDPEKDQERVAGARRAIGKQAKLFVDANGAYSRQQALAQARVFSESDVSWFEEPVLADDLEGLRLVRERVPAGMEVAAGEYGYDLAYFERMLEAGAVDVLQADVTRCAGITGFLKVAVLCEAHHLALSAHCAPALHLHPGCALGPFLHAEYFHDHARIEEMFFEGLPQPDEGTLAPDLSRSGHGLSLKRREAEKFAL